MYDETAEQHIDDLFTGLLILQNLVQAGKGVVPDSLLAFHGGQGFQIRLFAKKHDQFMAEAGHVRFNGGPGSF